MIRSTQYHTKKPEALRQESLAYNIVLQEGWTPLLAASHYGDVRIVQLLLANQADVNVQNEVRSMQQCCTHKYLKLQCTACSARNGLNN